MKHEDYYRNHPPKIDIESRLRDLLAQNVNEKFKDVLTFHKRLVKYELYLLNFLHYPDVTPDNNGAERTIRNIKVKQKISGQFKSMTGAINFAIVRSIYNHQKWPKCDQCTLYNCKIEGY